MSSDTVIRVEGLGKKYVIGHEAEREKYIALRDVIARAGKNAWRKLHDMVRGHAIIVGDTTEDFWALKDVSFEVKRGEVLGIIGRNGAGKSTLLKILSRITEPTEGRVTIEGRVASLLEVGTGFHPELTGRENIYLNGAILGMTRTEIKRKFDEIVAFSEVEKFLDTPVKRYSSGMYVRLAFAVAAHLEPEILVVDEVLAVGDAEFQKKCLGKIGEIAEQDGRTVLFVSHNMAAVRALCNQVFLLKGGRLAGRASAAEAISQYLNNTGRSLTTSDGFDRPHWAQPWIQRIETRNTRLEPTTAFQFCEDIVIDVAIQSPDGKLLPHPVLGVIVRTEQYQAITGISTRISGYVLNAQVEQGIYRCTIKSPNLIYGLYSLELWLQSDLQNVDMVIASGLVQIVSTDIYGTGVFPDSAHGPVHLSATWQFLRN